MSVEKQTGLHALVLGAAGNIGSTLCRRLIDDGHTVYGVDDMSGGTRTNLSDVIGHNNFQLITTDVRRLQFFKLPKADVVFHLAARVGVQVAVREGINVYANNTQITEAVLNGVAVSMPDAKLVVASSSEVYGDSDVQPCVETMPLRLPAPTNPRWAYTYSKAADEIMTLGYTDKGRVKGIVARLFNTASSRVNSAYGAVLTSMIAGAKAGRIIVHGDGMQTRSFLHARDTAAGLMTLALHGTVGGIYNIGGEIEVKIAGVANLVKEIVNPNAEIVFVPQDGAIIGCRRRVADVKKLMSLGWTYDMEGGLRPLIRELAA